jgi:hypothetical protein
VDSSDNGGSNLGSVMSSKNFTNIPKTGEEYQFNHLLMISWPVYSLQLKMIWGVKRKARKEPHL